MLLTGYVNGVMKAVLISCSQQFNSLERQGSADNPPEANSFLASDS